jgi:mannose-6-phosphate isomerase
MATDLARDSSGNSIYCGEDTRVSLQIVQIEDVKQVSKAWGEERWLVGELAPFGFKLIHITAGQRTSLQYHEQKEEANLVVQGKGYLIIGEYPGEELCRVPIRTGTVIHVRPKWVHRIEALENMTLVEVSTPELDDVIRIQDDWNRGNGRIEAEHLSAEHRSEED